MTDLPEPGRPDRLPSDDADAERLLEVLRSVAGFDVPASARSRVVREALWFLWERPRLPGPLVASKYPRAYPWSAAARASVEDGASWRPGGLNLVFEHLEPRRILVQELVARAATLGAAELEGLLHRGLAAAVVTKAEDTHLTKSGLSHRMPAGQGGPWARYLAAGIDVAGFAPLP